MIPEREFSRLEAVRGGRLAAIELLAMRDCGETYEERRDAAVGLAAVTWGVAFRFDEASFVTSWAEDGLGDPFRVACLDPASLQGIESLVPQDVSVLLPWSGLVGRRLEYADLLTYADDDADRSVAWAVRLVFGDRRLLVAAAWHEDPFRGPPCADELVIAHDAEVIRRLVRAWSG